MATKEIIIESFLSLLDEMCLDKITIKDICAKSELTRNSFYYHFSCMESLMDAAFLKVQSDFRAECSPGDSTLAESMDCVCRNLRQHRRKILHLYHSRYQNLLLQWAAQDSYRLMYLYVCQAVSEGSISDDAITKTAQAYALHLLGMFQQWILHSTFSRTQTGDFLQFYNASVLSVVRAEQKAALQYVSDDKA